jgi:hypothetical protein
VKPFQEQLAWSAFAVVCYVLPYLIPALKDAVYLQQFATFIVGKVWFFTPHEKERKKRESQPAEASKP